MLTYANFFSPSKANIRGKALNPLFPLQICFLVRFLVNNFLSLSRSAILGRKSTARLKVNQNTRSPPLSENLKFRKRMGFSVLGSLITVPLHSTLAVNNLGLKFVS